jgi:benzylsuccinate CoA-transferase BbsF subunit
VANDEEWAAFKRALESPSWAEDDRFEGQANRLKNSEVLDSCIQEWTQDHTAEEVMIALQKEGVPAGIVQNAFDLANDPQLRERGFFFELEHLEMGKVVSDASPIRLSENTPAYYRAAPVHGQDNDYVYRQLLNLSESEFELLKQEKII